MIRKKLIRTILGGALSVAILAAMAAPKLHTQLLALIYNLHSPISNNL